MSQKDKSLGFTLFLDQEHARAFNVLANMAYETLERLSPDDKQGLQKELRLIVNGIIKPFNHAYHEKGWCEDPNCTYDEEHDKSSDKERA